MGLGPSRTFVSSNVSSLPPKLYSMKMAPLSCRSIGGPSPTSTSSQRLEKLYEECCLDKLQRFLSWVTAVQSWCNDHDTTSNLTIFVRLDWTVRLECLSGVDVDQVVTGEVLMRENLGGERKKRFWFVLELVSR